jgi:hypothetical protein
MFRSCLVVKNPLLTLASVFLIAACGGGPAAAAAPTPVKFTMTTQNGSGVTGTGEIIRATGSFTLTIKLTGMTPNSSHVSHIHAGRCGVPGGIVYALQQVIADSSGAATTTSTLPAEYLVPASGWYVNVHQGPDFTEPEYAPSASCGDLSAA